MTITFDGERSKQRFGLARKWLGDLKMLGLPAKSMVHDGFTYRMSNIAEGLENARITAPDGLVLVCTRRDGASVLWADYWLGGFSGRHDLHVVDDAYGGSGQLLSAYQATLANAKFDPRQTRTFIVSDGFFDSAPSPTILPAMGERGWVCVSGIVEGVASWQIAECLLLGYQRSGQSDNRTCVAQQVADNTTGWELGDRVLQCMWSRYMSAVAHSIGTYLMDANNANAPSCAVVMVGGRPTVTTAFAHFHLATMVLGAPAGLQSALLSVSPTPAVAMGSYAFTKTDNEEATLLHCVNTIGASAHHTANPSDAPWKLFYTFYQFGAGVLHSFPVDTAVLDALVPTVIVGGVVDWDEARKVTRQLFPWPNNSHDCPVDSMMFHTLTGDVYSWSRKYGAVKFSTTGMSLATINIPPAASANVGTRPEIYNAGNEVFLCICTIPADAYEPDPADPTPYAPPPVGAWNGVRALYVGSPFGSWVELPYPSGRRLLHVRPLSATLTDVQLLGVVVDTVTGDINVASLTWNDVTGGGWRILAPIPVTVTDINVAQWNLCPYGEGGLTKRAMEFPHPPPALPQMPKVPYGAVIGYVP